MIARFLAFSCPHFPLQDNTALTWLGSQIKSIKPTHLIHLGDGIEADAASRWPSESSWTLGDEFEQHNDFLRGLREVSDGAELVYLNGNHEANVTAKFRINPKLRDLCDPVANQPELKNWKQFPYVYSKEGVYRLGQVSFAHGYEAGVQADENQSLILGLPFGLFIGGHTHAPKPVTQAKKSESILLPYWFANAGTLRDIVDVTYMERKRRSLWGQALVTGEVNLSAKDPYTRNWTAETRVFRMFTDL